MDIHQRRKMRVLEQRPKLRVLEQWRRRAGRARQLRVLAQMTKLQVVEQRAKVATPTATPPLGRGYHALTWRSHGHSLAA